ncbi:hypothetical protein GQX74_004417 [Glossina fuscipes]|nr:hypothetical protein GQX74_004417 [Glossina fuscipes]
MKITNSYKNNMTSINSSLSNAEELCKAIDPECLPQELGGRMSTEEMLKLWKCELLEKRETILKLDEITLLTDCGIQYYPTKCKRSGLKLT